MSQLTNIGAVHLAAGIAVSIAGFAAVIARKGTAYHVWAGRAFVAGMAMVCATGLWMSISRRILFTLLLTAFTAHLVATGWAAIRQDRAIPRGIERHSSMAALLLSLAFAVAAVFVALKPSGQADGLPYPAFLMLSGFSLMLWWGDFGCRQELSRKRRLVRHGGRLAVAQLIGLSIFAFGNSQILPASWRTAPILLTPIGIHLLLFTMQMAAIILGAHRTARFTP